MGPAPISGPAVMRLSGLVSVGRRIRSATSRRGPNGVGFGCSLSSSLRCARVVGSFRAAVT